MRVGSLNSTELLSSDIFFSEFTATESGMDLEEPVSFFSIEFHVNPEEENSM
jgi:hypothetical protein